MPLCPALFGAVELSACRQVGAAWVDTFTNLPPLAFFLGAWLTCPRITCRATYRINYLLPFHSRSYPIASPLSAGDKDLPYLKPVGDYPKPEGRILSAPHP